MTRPLCLTALIAAGAMTVATSASAREPRFELRAEWAGQACVLPTIFRVTLTNTGDTTFAVPERGGLGHGRPVNFQAELAQGAYDWNGEPVFSSAAFMAPPPAPDQPLTRLAPGESHAYDLPFDGYFSAHGGPGVESASWRGRFTFYYSLPGWVVEWMERGDEVVPVMSRASPVVSNALDCPES